MNELYFMGMDIIEETSIISKFTAILCTDGMDENELKAYNLGVENVLTALKTVLTTERNEVAVHIENFDIPTELTYDELQEYFTDFE